VQQSKYNRYRLHGCNGTELINEFKDGNDESTIDYPWCEKHDLAKIEKEFDATTNIKFRNPNNNNMNGLLWSKPGDCARIEEMIINGEAENGEITFSDCESYLDLIRTAEGKKRKHD